MLSLNGSPLANPYEFGWFSKFGAGEEGQGDEEEINGRADRKGKGKTKNADKAETKTLKRTNSILVRRDPSFAFSSITTTNGFHSRTNSQTSVASSQSTNHSRTNSETQLYTSHPPSENPPIDATPRPPARSQSQMTLPAAALVAIPTKDGHLLEFNPLQTSPGALDALEGITASAKKQAREEMGRLIQATVDKWKIK
jgi:hypothetical protein